MKKRALKKQTVKERLPAVPEYLTTARAARLIPGISTSTLYRAAKAKQIESFRTPGGHYRLSAASVRAFFLLLRPERKGKRGRGKA